MDIFGSPIRSATHTFSLAAQSVLLHMFSSVVLYMQDRLMLAGSYSVFSPKHAFNIISGETRKVHQTRMKIVRVLFQHSDHLLLFFFFLRFGHLLFHHACPCNRSPNESMSPKIRSPKRKKQNLDMEILFLQGSGVATIFWLFSHSI